MENELIQKAKECKSVDEIVALAKENGREITPEQAAGYFAELNPASGEIADEELDGVAGGCGSSEPEPDHYFDFYTCPSCGGNRWSWYGGTQYLWYIRCLNCGREDYIQKD